MAFNQSEVAYLRVEGTDFYDWESIEVKHVIRVPPYFTFRMTCSEPTPMGADMNFSKLQIVPGQTCEVFLAGQIAFSGQVYSRQVFYDAQRHYIEIQGASKTMSLTTSAAQTKTNEFKKVNLEQLCRSLLSPTKVALQVVGGALPTQMFDRVSIAPGTCILDVLEVHARPLGVDFTSNVNGDLVAVVGPEGSGANFTEGIDILEGREIIYNPSMAQGIYGVGQRPGNNQTWGPKAAWVPFFSKEKLAQLGNAFSVQVHPLEIPASTNALVQGRANSEYGWQQRDQVTVFVTVAGWLNPSGQLWKENIKYTVKSPMLVMDGSLPLTARSVTFIQNNQAGTRTTLELCNDQALQGLLSEGKRAGEPGAQQ